MSKALRIIHRVVSEEVGGKSIFPRMQQLWVGGKNKSGKDNWTQQLVSQRDKHLKSQVKAAQKK